MKANVSKNTHSRQSWDEVERSSSPEHQELPKSNRSAENTRKLTITQEKCPKTNQKLGISRANCRRRVENLSMSCFLAEAVFPNAKHSKKRPKSAKKQGLVQGEKITSQNIRCAGGTMQKSLKISMSGVLIV